MSRKHVDDVKALPCLVCGLKLRQMHAHHLMRGVPVNERGTARRAADRWAIPLCFACHEGAHRAGDDEAYLMRYRIDGRAVAEALWRERTDRKAMLRVVVRSLNARGIYVG